MRQTEMCRDNTTTMGLLPDTQNCVLRMRWECRERFPRHRFQRKPLVSDSGMHHGTCVTHVPWCMSGSLTCVAGKTFPAFPAHAQPAILHIWQEAHAIVKYTSMPTLMKSSETLCIKYLYDPAYIWTYNVINQILKIFGKFKMHWISSIKNYIISHLKHR